jgi:hypothetical protein
VTVHNGDLWSPYKRIRAHNQGDLKNKESKISYAILRETWTKRGKLPQRAKSLYMEGLVLP